jgi:hypothetical protein
MLAVAALYNGQAEGQTPAMPIEMSTDDLSKETENPVSRIIILPLRYEADFHDGPYDATKNTFELDQAILPFRLSDDWALITRTKFPAYSQPPKKLGDSWASGLGNGYTTFFLSPHRLGSTNGGLGPPRHSSERRPIAPGYLALSPTTSGRSVVRPRAATAPIAC